MRLLVISLPLLALTFAGCDKKGKDAPKTTTKAAKKDKPEKKQPVKENTAADKKATADKKPADKKSADKKPADTWIPYESKEGRFTAKFPSKPLVRTQNVPTAVGTLKMTMYSVRGPGMMIAVAIADFPPKLVKKRTQKQMFDGARDRAVQQVGGKLVKETKITVQGWPGRKLMIAKKAGGQTLQMEQVFCLAKNRLYQAAVVYQLAKKPEALLKKFFENFKPQAK
jgi:hypothetical protein